MIQSFGNRDTQRFFAGEQVAAFQGFDELAVCRLTLLDNAVVLGDLTRLRNRLESGGGDGHLSIRMNSQWRMNFRWTSGVGPSEVEMVDDRPTGGNKETCWKNGMRPVHPGEILRESLDALGLSANALSKELGAPVNRITMIMRGERGMSADSALRLARYFGMTPQMWLNLQKTWELRRAEIAAGDEIVERVTPRPSVA